MAKPFEWMVWPVPPNPLAYYKAKQDEYRQRVHNCDCGVCEASHAQVREELAVMVKKFAGVAR